jgi:hypothetical protein
MALVNVLLEFAAAVRGSSCLDLVLRFVVVQGAGWMGQTSCVQNC